MPSAKRFAIGKIDGTIYDFSEIGDVLPMHEHDEKTNHITVVARGRFRAHGHDWESEISAGAVLDWAAHDPHEFIALEPMSRVINIRK